jgi:tetratricopeptide (TPR) repeat protein
VSHSVRDRLALARGHLRRGELDTAEALLVALTTEHPRFADLQNELGLLFHERGDFAKAEAAFRKALELNPGYTEAALHLSITWNDLGRYEDASRVFSEAVRAAKSGPGALDPALARKVAALHVEIGDLYTRAGHPKRGADAYRTALDLCPTFHDVRLKRAQALLDCSDPEAAIREIETILAASPAFVPALVTLGVAHHAAGRRDRALETWRAVLAQEPANPQATMYLRLATGGEPGKGVP